MNRRSFIDDIIGLLAVGPLTAAVEAKRKAYVWKGFGASDWRWIPALPDDDDFHVYYTYSTDQGSR